MKDAQVIINFDNLDDEQKKALMKVCEDYEITYVDSNKVTKAGRKSKIMSKISKEKFIEEYSKWINGEPINNVLLELGITKPTFYRYIEVFKLKNKTDTEVENRTKEKVYGIDGNGLVIDCGMTVDEILNIVKKAIKITTHKELCEDVKGEQLNKIVCIFILDKIKYREKTNMTAEAVANGVNISEKTYYKYREQIRESVNLYSYANRVYKQLTILTY